MGNREGEVMHRHKKGEISNSCLEQKEQTALKRQLMSVPSCTHYT